MGTVEEQVEAALNLDRAHRDCCAAARSHERRIWEEICRREIDNQMTLHQYSKGQRDDAAAARYVNAAAVIEALIRAREKFVRF